MREEIKQFQQMVLASQNIVFFGGAGVSTESGIPDFRSVDGLYSQSYDYPPEKILSHSFFLSHPDEFFRFYREKMLFLDAQPNAAHGKLAELEKKGVLKAVITQNIDGLHQKAGSQNVLELHGSVQRNFCMNCRKAFSVWEIVNNSSVPRCSCGGMVKPDVVLYEEPLEQAMLKEAAECIQQADLVIIGGTSLAVYPAAGLIRYADHALVLINRSPTPMDKQADLVIRENIAQVFEQI